MQRLYLHPALLLILLLSTGCLSPSLKGRSLAKGYSVAMAIDDADIDPVTVIQPFTVYIEFSEATSGLSLSSISVKNASIASLTNLSSTMYALSLTPQALGEIQVSLKSGAGMNSKKESSPAATLNLVYDPSCQVSFRTTGSSFTGGLARTGSSALQWSMGGTLYNNVNTVTHNFGSNGVRENTVKISTGSELTWLRLDNAYYNPSNNIDRVNFSKGCYWMQGFYIVRNQLATIDVRALKRVETLDVGMNSISSLDLSKNTYLRVLIAYYNNLNGINVTKNTALQRLTLGQWGWQNVNNNNITSLDLSQNPALAILELTGATKMSSLDLRNNPALTDVTATGIWAGTPGSLQSIQLTGLTNLQNLNLYNNQLTSLDVSTNTALVRLDASVNQLTSINVMNNTALQYLTLFFNSIGSIDVTNNPALRELYLGFSGWTTTSSTMGVSTLNLSNNPLLTTLDVSDLKNMTSLNLTANTALVNVYVSGYYYSRGPLTSINLNGLTALKILHVNNQSLATLDISTNTALETLNVGTNYLTTINVTPHTALRSLSVNYNLLSSLNVGSNTALLTLSACTNHWGNDGNTLSTLNLSTNTLLTSLTAQCSGLTGITLTNNTALQTLALAGNTLSTLNLSTNTALTSLAVNGTQLSTLTLGSNTLLATINMSYNPSMNMTNVVNTIYAARATLPAATNFNLAASGVPAGGTLTQLNDLVSTHSWVVTHD